MDNTTLCTYNNYGGYLGYVGETSSNDAGHLRLNEAVALRRHDGRVDEPKKDGTVHRVHC